MSIRKSVLSFLLIVFLAVLGAVAAPAFADSNANLVNGEIGHATRLGSDLGK